MQYVLTKDRPFIIGSVARNSLHCYNINKDYKENASMTSRQTIFEAIGGFEPIDEIIDGMYKRVAVHPDLILIFPEDLEESARKQRLSLIECLGGPQSYNEERGHPKRGERREGRGGRPARPARRTRNRDAQATTGRRS